MLQISKFSRPCILGCGLILSAFVAPIGAHAKTFETLYAFKGGSDAAYPDTALVVDGAFNFYGTTNGNGAHGNGAIYKVAHNGTESVLYSFTGGADGGGPYSAVLLDKAGNLYGTTIQGGAFGAGVVYELAPDGTETVLHSFNPGAGDGGSPLTAPIADKSGNLYGVTSFGGAGDQGAIYKLTPDGTETVLHSFDRGTGDGADPTGLIIGGKGTLYGTTTSGGAFGYGTVFKLTALHKESVLYSFTNGADGGNPTSGVVQDAAGNLYGTAAKGGTSGEGVVFKLAADGTQSVLHTFTGGSDGAYPFGGIILDNAGNLYGMTGNGGSAGDGIIYELAPDGTETILYTFTGGSDGATPAASLMETSKYLYGTAQYGGQHGFGTVFQQKK